MSSIRKITVQELRSLITEAINEDSGIEDAQDQELEHEAQEDTTAATEDIQKANEAVGDSDEVLLERWKKLAGILKG